MARSYGMGKFYLKKKKKQIFPPKTCPLFPSDCNILHSLQHCRRIPVRPQARQHLVWSAFLVSGESCWALTVALSRVTLTINDAERFSCAYFPSVYVL